MQRRCLLLAACPAAGRPAGCGWTGPRQAHQQGRPPSLAIMHVRAHTHKHTNSTHLLHCRLGPKRPLHRLRALRCTVAACGAAACGCTGMHVHAGHGCPCPQRAAAPCVPCARVRPRPSAVHVGCVQRQRQRQGPRGVGGAGAARERRAACGRQRMLSPCCRPSPCRGCRWGGGRHVAVRAGEADVQSGAAKLWARDGAGLGCAPLLWLLLLLAGPRVQLALQQPPPLPPLQRLCCRGERRVQGQHGRPGRTHCPARGVE